MFRPLEVFVRASDSSPDIWSAWIALWSTSVYQVLCPMCCFTVSKSKLLIFVWSYRGTSHLFCLSKVVENWEALKKNHFSIFRLTDKTTANEAAQHQGNWKEMHRCDWLWTGDEESSCDWLTALLAVWMSCQGLWPSATTALTVQIGLDSWRLHKPAAGPGKPSERTMRARIYSIVLDYNLLLLYIVSQLQCIKSAGSSSTPLKMFVYEQQQQKNTKTLWELARPPARLWWSCSMKFPLQRAESDLWRWQLYSGSQQ